MKSKKVQINEIGEVLIERSPRAKHMRLSIRPFRGVRVAVPRGQSFAAAEQFAYSKTDWIKKHLKQITSIERQMVALNQGQPLDNKAATKRLANRLDELCKQTGLTCNRVSVKNQKTRWGSCSIKNNINLNANLVRLPEELIDYVILHELVHTKIKNHSKLFWEELSKFVTDPKRLDKNLRRYTPSLI